MISNGITVGAGAPPLGVTPNFDNPESIAYRVIIASVLGVVITIPICMVRLYTKRCILRNVGWDDYSIVLATLFALGFSILTGYHTTNGLGNHIWDVPEAKYYELMKVGGIAGPIFSNFATLFTKISLGIFYLRLSPFKTDVRVTVWAVLVASGVNSVLAAFGFAWVCQPIAKYWDFSITTGSCINLSAYFLATACINAATDLVLLVLPISIMRHLQLALHRKIGAGLLLMTGSFVCVVSLIRVQIVVSGMHVVATDGTWGMTNNFIWILVEIWLGIICACLPIVYTFVRTRLLSKRGSGDKVPFPAIRDPDSGLAGHSPSINIPDSGYQSEPLSTFSLEQMHEQRSVQEDGHEHSIRLAASNKSLLTTASRSDD